MPSGHDGPASLSEPAPAAEEARGSLVRSATVITLLTLASRLTGYARDRTIAAVFGAGAASDVFYTAFRIPNLLRQLVAEGALPGVFIPAYAEKRKHGSAEEARLFAARILSALTVVVSAITVAGILFAPAIVRAPREGLRLDAREDPAHRFSHAADVPVPVLHLDRRPAPGDPERPREVRRVGHVADPPQHLYCRGRRPCWRRGSASPRWRWRWAFSSAEFSRWPSRSRRFARFGASGGGTCVSRTRRSAGYSCCSCRGSSASASTRSPSRCRPGSRRCSGTAPSPI